MLKDILKALPSHQHDQLMCAFEQGIEQIITLDDGYFIGVNISSDDGIIEVAGRFAYGRVSDEIR